MIDIEKYKRILNRPGRMFNLSDDVVMEILNALEEGKEIIENLKETARTYAMQTYSKVAHKSADTAENWLSKYFEEPLGNNGEPIKNINPEVCEERLERLSHETE